MVRKTKVSTLRESREDIDSKHILPISNTSTVRWKEPTSKMAHFNMQFVHDYGTFAKVIPDNRPNTLIEASVGPKGRKSGNTMSLNKRNNNRSVVFGSASKAFVGSGGDERGNF